MIKLLNKVYRAILPNYHTILMIWVDDMGNIQNEHTRNFLRYFLVFKANPQKSFKNSEKIGALFVCAP